MYTPEITPSNQLAIDALTHPRIAHLDPIDDFRAYAERFGDDLTDDPAYSQALTIDFEDYTYLHDTSRLTPIYLNDFDFKLEEDREKLSRLTRMDFDSNTFETVASCSCGHLKGNYLIGSNLVCSKCGDKVERFLERGNDSKLWLRLPEGVKAFINIGFYSTFFTSITVSYSSPKICLPRYFIDPTYRKSEQKRRTQTLTILNHILDELGIEEVNLNSFVDNCDRIMDYLLIGPGTRYNGLSRRASEMYELWQQSKHVAFCKYLKVPNRFSTIVERSGREVYCAEGQLETAQLYFAIADTAKSDAYYTLSQKDVVRNVEIVGKNLIKLAEQYAKGGHSKMLFHKKGISRKHVCSGAVPFTGRSVITSETGIINSGCLTVPWNMALAVLEYHITNKLYRSDMTPWQTAEYINLSAYKVDPLIDKFFADMENERKAIIQAGRNPSIEYLSLRTFFMLVNRNLDDESIKIPILACGPYNADFDGDNMYIRLMVDNESKAKAYGALGHHLMLDPNNLFRVGRYAGQSATNLMNLNMLMQQVAIQE